MGDFKRGWELFDFGLRTPADGKQKWQRALLKPFSNNILQVWDGKHSLQSRILLLEEQAVGDVMMFLTMLPSILEKFASVGIFLTPRLKSIYKRSFRSYISSGKLSLYTKSDLRRKLDPRIMIINAPSVLFINIFSLRLIFTHRKVRSYSRTNIILISL